MTPLRAVYLDLDGTLLGREASVLLDAEGAFTLDGVRALEACARAGAEVVFYSGRRQATLFHDARILGVRSYAFEAGAGLVVDGEVHWLTGTLVPRDGMTIFEQITASGAPALLLDHYAGRLEYHSPWHTDREVSHLYRGLVDAAEADALLAARGLGHLRLVDNGAIHRRSPTLDRDIEQARAYHLVPRDASKARAVAAHMRIRGLAPDEVIAVGDSREDALTAEAVGTFWLVANGAEKDPALASGLASNVRVCQESHGSGVYEAVITELAERRG